MTISEILGVLLYIIIFLSFFVVFFGAPYVPTLSAHMNDMTQLYSFTKRDVFVDIGCGDGRVLRYVTPKVRKSVGYELSPVVWLIARILSRSHPQIHIYLANFWHISIPRETTVVYTFLSSHYMPKLQKKLQAHATLHQKPIYLISHGFGFDNQKPIKTYRSMKLFQFDPLQKA